MASEPTDQGSGNDVKEILAPTEGPREDLISTAVKFLQNPKVASSPLNQKKAFLEKKGLTQAEIDIAVQRSGVVEASAAPSGDVQLHRPGAAMPPQGMMQPVYAPIPPQSGWARARDLTMTTVVVASVSYAVYQLFQTYLRPWLMGKSQQERRMERLEQEVKAIQSSVQESLAQISQTLAAIQLSMTEQKQQTISNQGDLRGIGDLRTDIASLKGLMLNKSQFPPPPSTTPVLPSWQRASSTSNINTSSPPQTAASALPSQPQGDRKTKETDSLLETNGVPELSQVEQDVTETTGTLDGADS